MLSASSAPDFLSYDWVGDATTDSVAHQLARIGSVEQRPGAIGHDLRELLAR